MESNNTKPRRAIASFFFIVIAVVGAWLSASFIYMKYAESEVKESNERAKRLMAQVDLNPLEVNEERALLTEFRNNNPEIEESAAYWLYSLKFYETLGKRDEAQAEFENAVRELSPNDLRLFLKIKVTTPSSDRASDYYYKGNDGEEVDLLGCYAELENHYQELFEGASEDTGSLLGNIHMMNYLMFPEVFGKSCSQLETFKKV